MSRKGGPWESLLTPRSLSQVSTRNPLPSPPPPPPAGVRQRDWCWPIGQEWEKATPRQRRSRCSCPRDPHWKAIVSPSHCVKGLLGEPPGLWQTRAWFATAADSVGTEAEGERIPAPCPDVGLSGNVAAGSGARFESQPCQLLVYTLGKECALGFSTYKWGRNSSCWGEVL